MGLRKVLLGLLLVAGCRSASLEPGIDRLAGTWRWIASSGGIAGITVTPASVNYTAQIRFNGSHVTVLRNDSVKASTTFTIRGDSMISYQSALPVFVYGGGVDAQRLSMSGDTLVLNDPCCDLFSHLFVRVR
jgi:hypothetical protein